MVNKNILNATMQNNAGFYSGFRNKIINGDFEIAQRGTVFTYAVGTGSSTYTIDRWRYSGNHAGTATTISQLDVPTGTIIPAYVKKYLRFNRVTTGTASVNIQTRIEGVRILSGKRSTLTFYVRGTAGKTIIVGYGQSFGTGGSPSPDVYYSENVQLTDTFTRVDIVFSIPSIPANTVFGTDGNDYLSISFNLNNTEGNCQFDIAHVSLVEGDATNEIDPFGARHIQQELNLCQRYCCKMRVGLQVASVGTSLVYYNFPVQMRAIPTQQVLDAGGTNSATISDSKGDLTNVGFYFQINTTASGAYVVGHTSLYTAEL